MLAEFDVAGATGAAGVEGLFADEAGVTAVVPAVEGAGVAAVEIGRAHF